MVAEPTFSLWIDWQVGLNWRDGCQAVTWARFRITYTENKAQLKTKEKAKPKQALLHINMKPVF